MESPDLLLPTNSADMIMESIVHQMFSGKIQDINLLPFAT